MLSAFAGSRRQLDVSVRAKARDASISNLSIDDKIARLEQLSEVGEVRSVFSATARESLEEPHDDVQLQQVEWGDDDPATHNLIGFGVEDLPHQIPEKQLYALQDFKEDEAVVQIPLHNCLVVYLWERVHELEEADEHERVEAVEQLLQLQWNFLQQFQSVHGEVPEELLNIICDFTPTAPSSHFKVALWLLWISERCSTSPYWSIILDALPEVGAMPQPVLCTEWELEQLQWPPMTSVALARKHGLQDLYENIIETGLPQKLGFRCPKAADSAGAQEAAGDAPVLTFERFAWAYIVAHKRSFLQADRLFFFPQIDPAMYTNDLAQVNTTVAITRFAEDVVDELACMVAMRDIQEGEVLGMWAPIDNATSGATSDDVFWAFGHVIPGNENDLVDFLPDVGSELDVHLKTIMGQGEAASLDYVTDPELRNLLTLVEEGKMPREDLPPIDKMLPRLQVPSLWLPGVLAGTRSSIVFQVQPVPAHMMDGQAVEGATMVQQVPANLQLLQTPEGRATFRRMQAAFNSLPKLSLDNKAHGQLMDAAIAGAPLSQVFTSPAALQEEKAKADQLLRQLTAVVAAFPTTPDEDRALIASALSGAQEISPGMHAVVTWRLEWKLLWQAMADLTAVYKQALAQV